MMFQINPGIGPIGDNFTLISKYTVKEATSKVNFIVLARNGTLFTQKGALRTFFIILLGTEHNYQMVHLHVCWNSSRYLIYSV